MSEKHEEYKRVEVHPNKEAIVRFDPRRTFHCVDECSWCCERGVLLYEPDLFDFAAYASIANATVDLNGHTFTDREEKDRESHVGPDGKACVFLDGEGKCELHAEHDWKPTRCSVFPLEVDLVDGELVVDVRDDAETHCEGMDVGERRLIDNLDAFLPPTLWTLPDPRTSIEL